MSASDRDAPPPFRVQPPPPPPGPDWLTEGVDQRNPWTVLSSAVRYDTAWLRLAHHDVLTPAGTPNTYGVVELKSWAGAVLAVDARGQVPLVGQWRFGCGYYSWELPQGGVPLDAQGRCDPLDGTKRELREETGYTAGQWLEVMRMDMSNSLSTEHAVCHVAWDLTAGQAAPDEVERLHIRLVSFGALCALVRDGVIRDAITIGLVQHVRLRHLEGALPADLMAALACGL